MLRLSKRSLLLSFKTGKSNAVGVIGAGAIGRTLAQHFEEQSISPVLGERQSFPEALATCALVFVTVKAYALQEALDQWTPYLQKGCVVVICCNGDVESIVSRARTGAADRLYLRRGLVTFGARHAGGRWEIVGETGRLYWGDEAGGEPKEIEKWIIARSRRLAWEPMIRQAIVMKWISNATINTVAAAYRLRTNGGILEMHADEFSSALDEAIVFAKKRWPDVALDPETVRQKILEIVRDTSANENSMARDIARGQQTEVDFLSGIVPNAPEFATLNRLTNQI